MRTNLRLTKSQREAYRLIHLKNLQMLCCCWSRQSGKSVFAELCVVERLLMPRQQICYITPTFDLARKVFREIHQLISQTGLVKSSNKTLLTIEMQSGSTLKFFSAEAPKAIRGNTCKGLLVIDEAAFMPDTIPSGEELWGNIIQPITKAHHPKVLMISTPAGKQGFFYRFFLRGFAKRDDPDYGKYRNFKATIYDDDLASPEEIEEIKRGISPLAFRQEYMCEFLATALTAFGDYDKRFIKYGKEDKQPGDRPVWGGIDFSSTDGGDATVVTFLDRDGHTWQHEISGTLDIRYKKIAELLDSHRLIMCYGESNSIGTVMINEIKKLMKKNRSKLREWETTASSKNPMIGLLQTRIANGEIDFDEANTKLFSEMGTFTYTVGKNQRVTYAAKPPHHDDYPMSMAIAVQCSEDFKATSGSSYVVIQTRQSGAGLR